MAAIAQAMRQSESVFMMGQDVGEFGGAMSGSAGLYDEFGPRRVSEILPSPSRRWWGRRLVRR